MCLGHPERDWPPDRPRAPGAASPGAVFLCLDVTRPSDKIPAKAPCRSTRGTGRAPEPATVMGITSYRLAIGLTVSPSIDVSVTIRAFNAGGNLVCCLRDAAHVPETAFKPK